ncbi:exonuclease family protein [Klebsiella aerogenes]|uniref:hypothetical protein n=1 Tax=Klebsiella aerogenes TaxID=548 RepID=UPI001F2C6BF1|nr:hypothetical protein [Klebsiella aerogenes]
MSAELKIFGVIIEAMKKFNKRGERPIYSAMIRARNKSAAEAIAYGDFMKTVGDEADKYFKPKVWLDRPGLPRMQLEAGFCTDFFGTVAIWNPEAGEPEFIPVEEMAEETGDQPAAPIEVKTLSTQERIFSLVLFGPYQEITPEQYGQILDMKNDDNSSAEHELAEAITKEPRLLQIIPVKQEECLAWVRHKAKASARWPDYKNLLVKWLDTSPDKREPVPSSAVPQTVTTDTHTESGVTLGGGNPTDRPADHVHNLASLRRDVARGVVSTAMDYDIYAIPHEIEQRAKSMDEEGKDPRFNAWWKQVRRTPGMLDYSLAAVIALIKNAPEDLYLKPIEHREYINRHLIEADHAKPSAEVIAVACGRSSMPLPQKNKKEKADAEAGQEVQTETAAAAAPQSDDKELRRKTDLQLAHQRGEYIPEMGDDPKDEKWDNTLAALRRGEAVDVSFKAEGNGEPTPATPAEDNRPAMNAREIAIALALNDLLSGRTNVMSREEAEGVVGCTGHLIPDIAPLIIADIIETEEYLSPEFSDTEIHDVATTILDSWSDDENVRQKIALDAIDDCRRDDSEPEKEKSVSTELPAKAESVNQTTLTYKQQLTVAAIQGLCANPACFGLLDDTPSIVDDMVNGILRNQGEANG